MQTCRSRPSVGSADTMQAVQLTDFSSMQWRLYPGCWLLAPSNRGINTAHPRISVSENPASEQGMERWTGLARWAGGQDR